MGTTGHHWWRHFGYILATFWLLFGYILATLWLHSGYILVIFWLYFGYILVTFWLYFGYILAIFWLHFVYILATFWLHSDYILAIFWLNFGYIDNCWRSVRPSSRTGFFPTLKRRWEKMAATENCHFIHLFCRPLLLVYTLESCTWKPGKLVRFSR